VFIPDAAATQQINSRATQHRMMQRRAEKDAGIFAPRLILGRTGIFSAPCGQITFETRLRESAAMLR
jgi:hypothetical protein